MNNLKQLESISLSDDQIKNMLKGKINVIQYPELQNYKNIDEVLYPYDACVILYLTSKGRGHWILVQKLNPRIIEVFDSYGTYIDNQNKYNLDKYAKKVQYYPFLTKLLYDSPYIITYNEFQLQEKKKGINTCGRYVVLRNLLKNLSIYDFVKIFRNSKYNPDELVTIITENII